MMLQVANSPSMVKLNRDGTPSRLLKRSKIWEVYWIVPDDPSKAVCKECQGVISRGGGTGKSQCTTNLWKHLENRHPAMFKTMGKFKEVVHRSQDNVRTPKIMDGLTKPDDSKIWELFIADKSDTTLIKCLECGTDIKRLSDDNTDILWCHLMADHPETYTKCVSEAIQVAASASGSKRSDVWNEFTQHPLDFSKVVCNTCDAIVSRGTSRERLNTTNMRRHLTGNVHLNALRSKGLLPNRDSDQVTVFERDSDLSGTDGITGNGFTDKDSSPRSLQNRHLRNNSNGTDLFNFHAFGHKSGLLGHSDLSSIIMRRQVDLVHTGLLGRALYEQQKQGLCCDFSIVAQYKSPSQSLVKKSPASGSAERDPVIECADEFRIHRCVALAMSEKLRSSIESGSERLQLTDVSKESVPCFIEIMYTGRLSDASNLKKPQLQEILDLAEVLSAPSVVEYMKRSHPKLTVRSNINQKMVLPSLQEKEDHATHHQAPSSLAPSCKDGVVSQEPVLQQGNENEQDQMVLKSEPDFIDTNDSAASPDIIDCVTNSPGTPTSVPKVNKRKNYMPISNSVGRKKARVEDHAEASKDQNISPDSSSDVDID